MAKETTDFCAVPNWDELEADELEIARRRIGMYDKDVLKLGIRLDGMFLGYPAFDQALSALDRVFQIAPEVRMPHGLRLKGPPGSGKTALQRYFRDSLPHSSLFEIGFGCVIMPIGTMPSAGHIVGSLLRTYKYPFQRCSEQSVYWRKDIAFELIESKGTRLVCFDNAHRLVDPGRPRPGRAPISGSAASVICELMDAVRVGVCLAGGEELGRLDEAEPELASRITGCYELHNFRPDKLWSVVVKAFVKNCNWFDLSRLDSDAQIKTLHIATDGNMRMLKRLLTEAVLVAAQAKQSAVHQDHLFRAFTLVYGTAAGRKNPYA